MDQVIFLLAMMVAIAYVFFITKISDGWDETVDWFIPDKFVPKDKWTVIIPFRNEAENLPALLELLYSQDYPDRLLEVILVDDHSDDGSSEIARQSGFTYIALADKSGKKAALEEGIARANSDYILCTDADVLPPETWVSAFASYFSYQSVDFVSGLVKTSYRPYHFLDAFQFMDFATMMQVNASGIKKQLYYIANGANMAFRKSAFYAVGGFAGHQDIASGDDMFLIQAMADNPKLKVGFLKSVAALVTTSPESSIAKLVSQRKRWSTKTRYYAQRNITKVQAMVVFVHVFIIFYLIITPWTGGVSFFAGVFLLFIKWIMDYLFIAKVCRYYSDTKPLKYFIPAAGFYFFILFVSAFFAFTGSAYQWKGRRVEK